MWQLNNYFGSQFKHVKISLLYLIINPFNVLILYSLKTGDTKWEHGGRNGLNNTPFL